MKANFNIGDKVIIDESATNEGIFKGYVGKTGTITEFLNNFNTMFTVTIDGSQLDPIAIEAKDITVRADSKED